MNDLKNNKFLVLLVILFSFFVLIFFTRVYYIDLQTNLDDKNTKIEKQQSLDSSLEELNKLKEDLEDKQSIITKDLKNFIGEFSEDKIILYINDYVEKVNKSSWRIVLYLDNISFSEAQKSELWFQKVSINLKIRVYDRFSLKNLLEYLTSKDNEYSFFITSLNFPIEKSWPYNINLPLDMYIIDNELSN